MQDLGHYPILLDIAKTPSKQAEIKIDMWPKIFLARSANML